MGIIKARVLPQSGLPGRKLKILGLSENRHRPGWRLFSFLDNNIVGADVGALRKHAGGMFLASDLGGYAAAASILSLKVPSYVGGPTESSAPTHGHGISDRADRVVRPYECLPDIAAYLRTSAWRQLSTRHSAKSTNDKQKTVITNENQKTTLTHSVKVASIKSLRV